MDNKQDKTFIIIIAVTIFIALMLFLFPPLSFKLNGESNLSWNLGEEYQDPGATLKLFGIFDISNQIITSDDINVNRSGNYTQEYSYHVGISKGKLTRNISVSDIKGPKIEPSEDYVVVVPFGGHGDLPLYNAYDYTDGDMTYNLEYGYYDEYYHAYQLMSIRAVDSKGNETIHIQPIVVLDYVPDEKFYLPEGIFYAEVNGHYWYFYGYVEDTNGLEMKLRIKSGLKHYDIDINQLDTDKLGYFEANVDLDTIENGDYEVVMVQGDKEIKLNLEYIIDYQKLGRMHIGDRLFTWNFDQGTKLKVENFKYEYDLVIDVGHGGNDVGAIAVDGTIEADINLEVSLYEKERYEELGVKVKLLRDKEYYENLLGEDYWSEFQKECWTLGWYGATSKYTYSNHHNSDSSNSRSGAEVILNPDDNMDNQKIAYELADIFWDLFPNPNTKWKVSTRDFINGSRLDKQHGERYPGRAYYGFLRIPLESFNINNVLYEGSFINNEEEYDWYWKKGNWKKVSEAKIKAYVEALGLEYVEPKD